MGASDITMQIQQSVSLRPYNTLQFDVQAAYFARISSIEDLSYARDFCLSNNCPWLLIGGGSNLVLTENFEGLVMVMAMEKVVWPKDNTNDFLVTAEAGYEWDRLVAESITRGASGLENLSLIPGQIGAAPIQNIGAYGVEVKQSLVCVDVYDFDTGRRFTMQQKDCELGYRHSIFKAHKHWLVTAVTLRLEREQNLSLDYGIIKATVMEQVQLTEEEIDTATCQQVRDAVISIRRSKLPDPTVTPNVGSFFKNPVVNADHEQKLRLRFTNLVAYQTANGDYKLAAGWLIDQLGWKGYKVGSVGVHDKQALVLVCEQMASGDELLALAHRIMVQVKAEFEVELEIEPRLFNNRGEFWL